MTPLAYGVKDAAAAIGVSAWQLRHWIADGRIPVLKLPEGNRRVLIAATDLEKFVAALDRVAAPEPDEAMSRAARAGWTKRRAVAR